MKANKIRDYKRIYTITKLLLLFLFILLISISSIYYKVSRVFINRVNTDDVLQVSWLFKKIHGEEVVFKSREGNITLKGIFFPASIQSNKTLILVHGYNESKFMSGRTKKIVEYIIPRGYNVFTFDLRGHGQSEGDLISFGYNERFDVIGAIDYLNKRGKEGEKIALLGFSMGAVAAIEAAGQDPRIDVIIADSPIRDLKLFISTDLKNLSNNLDRILTNLDAEQYYSILKYLPFKEKAITLICKFYGIEIDQVSPMNTVKKSIKQPLLLIHGKCDEYISCTNSEEIFKLANNNYKTEIWITENADHIQSLNLYTDEYLEKLEVFLGQHM